MADTSAPKEAENGIQNEGRIPEDFVSKLSPEQPEALVSQSVIRRTKWKLKTGYAPNEATTPTLRVSPPL